MTPDHTLPPVAIQSGLSLDAALAGFHNGCNHPPARLWIAESRIAIRVAAELLGDLITDAEVDALIETVLKERYLDDVIEGTQRPEDPELGGIS